MEKSFEYSLRKKNVLDSRGLIYKVCVCTDVISENFEKCLVPRRGAAGFWKCKLFLQLAVLNLNFLFIKES